MSTPRILSIVRPALYDRLFATDTRAKLHAIGEVTLQPDDTPWTPARLAGEIGGYDALLTCWGAPKLTPAVLEAADRLAIVAHSAGSVNSSSRGTAGAGHQGLFGVVAMAPPSPFA